MNGRPFDRLRANVRSMASRKRKDRGVPPSFAVSSSQFGFQLGDASFGGLSRGTFGLRASFSGLSGGAFRLSALLSGLSGVLRLIERRKELSTRRVSEAYNAVVPPEFQTQDLAVSPMTTVRLYDYLDRLVLPIHQCVARQRRVVKFAATGVEPPVFAHPVTRHKSHV